MAPTPTDGMTTSSASTADVNDRKTESFPIAVIPADHNENFLAVIGDGTLFVNPSTDGSGSEGIYTTVDKEFLELMLDAVKKGFMPPELSTADSWLNNPDVDEGVLNGSVHLLKSEIPAIVADSERTNDEDLKKDPIEENIASNSAMCEHTQPMLGSTVPTSLSDGSASDGVEPTFSTNGALDSAEPNAVSVEPSNNVGPSLASVDLDSQSRHVGPSLPSAGQSEIDNIEDGLDGLGQTSELPLDSVEPDNSTPNKKVHFLGLDTVFDERSKTADFNVSISSDQATNDTGLEDMVLSSPRTVTWASLDSHSRTPRLVSRRSDKSHSSPKEGLCRFETAVHDKESDPMSDGDQEDPFMAYLNSIEQTALKFKLQVEQAKVDTLEALKEKLERAYEGTPLEEIPVKFREKLQETISEIASDEVLKRYQSLVSQDEEMTEEENAILECMRNELDSVACENFELHQQLELLKDYEKRYYDLKESFDSLNNGMTTIKNEYEKKNGESKFLAERVESLEKSIVNLRVEYSNQITDLQNENLQQQKTCLELENSNKMLEEGIVSETNGLSGSHEEESARARRKNGNKTHRQELDLLKLRIEELEKQNDALRAASQADQAMVNCVGEKKEELEKSLIKAQDDHSNVLLELHEAQRQISSDRVKLSSYQEEVDALRRENKLLKSSLEIAQNELEYHVEKKDSKDEPWKDNKRMIWREIRELEKILKDVHREKKSLEKKYVSFKHENDQLNGSFSFQSQSSSENSPERERGKHDKETMRGKSWHSVTETESNKTSLTNGIAAVNDDSFTSPPVKVKSWLDGLHTPNGVAKSEDSFDHAMKDRTMSLSERY